VGLRLEVGVRRQRWEIRS